MSVLENASHRVRLASPYVSAGVAHELASLAKDSAAEWAMITSLDAAAVAHGSLSIQGLRELKKASVHLRTARNLHAKVYLCDAVFGLVGSANLTYSGLGSGVLANLELGYLLPPEALQVADVHFDSWWTTSVEISEEMLVATEVAPAKLPTTVPVPTLSGGQQDPITADIALANQLLDEAGNVGLWVKALYRDDVTADTPWQQDSFVNSSKKGQPSFAIGDLLLIYAKGVGRCNAVLQVVEESRHDIPFLLARGVARDGADRWPYVTPARPRLQVPVASGVPLSAMGFTGQSLQGGHKRLGLSEFAAAVRHMTGSL
jgi:hypothetical protein